MDQARSVTSPLAPLAAVASGGRMACSLEMRSAICSSVAGGDDLRRLDMIDLRRCRR